MKGTCILLPFRKSLKSLFFLLPLLGVTNILHHVWPNPLRGSWQSFAVWSFTLHFLYSFQGVFVASVYFLFDKKVHVFQVEYNNQSSVLRFILSHVAFKSAIKTSHRNVFCTIIGKGANKRFLEEKSYPQRRQGKHCTTRIR